MGSHKTVFKIAFVSLTANIQRLFLFSLKALVVQLYKFPIDNDCMPKIDAKISTIIFMQPKLFTIFDCFSQKYRFILMIVKRCVCRTEWLNDVAVYL